MKRLATFINSLSIALFVSAVSVVPAFADNFLCPQGTSFSALCGIKGNKEAATSFLGKAIQLAFLFAIIVALFYLIWGGIKWILSGGDKGAVETARATIIAAVIGLIVTFASYFILNLVLGFFNMSLDNITFPTLV